MSSSSLYQAWSPYSALSSQGYCSNCPTICITVMYPIPCLSPCTPQYATWRRISPLTHSLMPACTVAYLQTLANVEHSDCMGPLHRCNFLIRQRLLPIPSFCSSTRWHCKQLTQGERGDNHDNKALRLEDVKLLCMRMRLSWPGWALPWCSVPFSWLMHHF